MVSLYESGGGKGPKCLDQEEASSGGASWISRGLAYLVVVVLAFVAGGIFVGWVFLGLGGIGYLEGKTDASEVDRRASEYSDEALARALSRQDRAIDSAIALMSFGDLKRAQSILSGSDERKASCESSLLRGIAAQLQGEYENAAEAFKGVADTSGNCQLQALIGRVVALTRLGQAQRKALETDWSSLRHYLSGEATGADSAGAKARDLAVHRDFLRGVMLLETGDLNGARQALEGVASQAADSGGVAVKALLGYVKYREAS